jgi:hypothetical protein
MNYYTRAELRRVPVFESKALRVERYHTKSASVSEHIFLSHSHKDQDIVEQVVELLGNQGIRVYVDWKDITMPEVTSPETAAKIKNKIVACNKFVLLATNYALASRWVPWELGVADVSLSMPHVAIMPVLDPPIDWKGNEYIGIYSTLKKSNNGNIEVFEPGKTYGITLRDWLQRKKTR